MPRLLFWTILAIPLLLSLPAQAQELPDAIPLWQNGAPGFENRRDEPETVTIREEPDLTFPVTSNIHNPSITPHLPPPERATGAAVVIAPGGGHRILTMGREGNDVARFLNEHGVAGFVLKYRLAREPDSPYSVEEHAKQDGQRAIRLVRSRAAEWGIDPNRVGILGFSAGGTVVSHVAFDEGSPLENAADPVDGYSAKPNFQVSIYAGPGGIPEGSLEGAPPFFGVVAADDRLAPVMLELVPRLREAGVPVEMHLYSAGGHGFGIRRDRDMAVTTWPERLVDWMKDQKLLDKPQ